MSLLVSLLAAAAQQGSSEWYSAWQTAWNAQETGTSQAHIVCFGDSVTQGYYATAPYYQNGWAGQIAGRLATRTGQAVGTGVLRVEEEFVLTDDRTSSAGTWTTSSAGGFFSQIRIADASGDTYTLGPITCTAFKIMYITTPGGGSFTATIDGGSPQTISCNASNNVEIIEIDAGVSGSHTLVIAGSTGNSYLVSVEAIHNELRGVKLSRIALSGSECSQLTVDANAFSSRQCYLKLDPDLAIIAFGLNEALNGTTTATFEANLNILVDDMKALGASVLIVAAPPPNTAWIAEATWTNFRTSMETVATAKGVGFFDMIDYWISYAANTPYYNDNVHPNNTGHWDMGALITNYIAELVDPTTPSTWAPTDLSGLALWLDSTDDASFTYSSGTLVSQWNDRSTNGRNFTQGTTSNQPDRSATVFGRKAVYFDGVDNVMGAGDTLDLGTNSLAIFTVVKFNNVVPTSGTGRTIIGKYKVTSSDGSWILLLQNQGGAGAKIETVYDAGSLATASSAVFSTSTPVLLSVILDRVNGSITERINMVTDGTTTFTPDSGSSRNIAHGLWLGALRNSADTGFQSSYWFNGLMCETIIVTGATAIGSSDRDAAEAYLARKFGIIQ